MASLSHFFPRFLLLICLSWPHFLVLAANSNKSTASADQRLICDFSSTSILSIMRSEGYNVKPSATVSDDLYWSRGNERFRLTLDRETQVISASVKKSDFSSVNWELLNSMNRKFRYARTFRSNDGGIVLQYDVDVKSCISANAFFLFLNRFENIFHFWIDDLSSSMLMSRPERPDVSLQ